MAPKRRVPPAAAAGQNDRSTQNDVNDSDAVGGGDAVGTSEGPREQQRSMEANVGRSDRREGMADIARR